MFLRLSRFSIVNTCGGLPDDVPRQKSDYVNISIDGIIRKEIVLVFFTRFTFTVGHTWLFSQHIQVEKLRSTKKAGQSVGSSLLACIECLGLRHRYISIKC